MPVRQHARMNSVALIRNRPWLASAGLLLATVVLVLASVDRLRAPRIAGAPPAAFGTLLRWHADGRELLLVADGQADRLTLYSPADGRHLGDVDVGHGLRDVAGLVQYEGHVFVVGDDGAVDELRLPQLRLVAARGP